MPKKIFKKIKKLIIKGLQAIIHMIDGDTRMQVCYEALKIVSKHTKNKEDDMIAHVFALGLKELRKDKQIDQGQLLSAIDEINKKKEGCLANFAVQAGKTTLNMALDATPFGKFINL